MLRLTASFLSFGLAVALLAGCARAADATLPAQIGAVFSEAHEDGEFDGAVLVTRDGTPIYGASFGFADRERKIGNTADTKFIAFSVNKPVTAVLVFQRIEAGKLRLEDRLDHLFANLAGKPAGAITIRQLLAHTSGIEEIINRHR